MSIGNNYKQMFQLMLEQWEVLKKNLYSGATDGLTIEELTVKYDFLERFNQIIEGTQNISELLINSLGHLYRGVSVNKEVALDNYDRMIPIPELVKNHNRMNTPGEAFIYLGIIPNRKGRSLEVEKQFILKTLAAELRAKKGDYYTVCRFEANNEKRIFDMTGNPSIPKDEKEFYKYLDRKVNSAGSNKQERQKVIAHTVALFFFNLFNNEEIFKPVHSEDDEVRAYEYAPFQMWAKYIRSKGYAGIKYRSTVHEGGTNLVLFEVENVTLIKSSMERILL